MQEFTQGPGVSQLCVTVTKGPGQLACKEIRFIELTGLGIQGHCLARSWVRPVMVDGIGMST
jgi:hypothetical protein